MVLKFKVPDIVFVESSMKEVGRILQEIKIWIIIGIVAMAILYDIIIGDFEGY